MKKCRIPPTEIRENIRGNYLLHNLTGYSSSSTLMNAGTSQREAKIVLGDYGSPLDVEEILSSRAVARTEIHQPNSTSPQRLRDVIEKDVEIDVLAKQRYINSDELWRPSSAKAEPHITDLIAFYEQDYSVVQSKYEEFGSEAAYTKNLEKRAEVAGNLPQHTFESDVTESHATLSQPNGRRQSATGVEKIELKRFSELSVESSSSSKDERNMFHSSACDPVISSILDVAPLNIEKSFDQKQFNVSKNCLVSLYPPLDEEEVVEKYSKPGIATISSLPRLSVKMLQLSFSPNFEPVFGTMAVFDLKSKERISENFHFDCNSDEVAQYISSHYPFNLVCASDTKNSKQALFALNNSMEDLYLVIRLEKVLQGSDINEALEPYLKDEKNSEKHISLCKDFCSRLGTYRMQMGWMAIELRPVIKNALALHRRTALTSSIIKVSADEQFHSTSNIISGSSMDDDTLSVISADRLSYSENLHKTSSTVFSHMELENRKKKTSQADRKSSHDAAVPEEFSKDSEPTSLLGILKSIQPLIINISSFYKQDSDHLTDDEIIKIISNWRKYGISKGQKLKSFPAELKIELSTVTLAEVSGQILSPELLPVEILKVPMSPCFVKDVLMFSKHPDFAVNYEYRNLLYIYPKCVNMSNRAGNARNISIKVELMDSKNGAIPAIYGKSKGPKYLTRCYTSVTYHCKNPQFCDEIKIQLPIDLNDGHYLLFTFYHISCKSGKETESIETPIGYTWLPVYKTGALQAGNYSLPISQDTLPEGIFYLSPQLNIPNIKWIDGHKLIFDVKIVAVSTVHTQDDHLTKFFHTYQNLKSAKHSVSEDEMANSIQNIVKARPEPISSYLYVILHKLVSLMASQPFSERITKCCFEVLCQLVKICTMLLDSHHDRHGRSNLLLRFIRFYEITSNDIFPQKACQSQDERLSARNSARDSENLMKLIQNYEKANSTKLLANNDELIHMNKKLLYEEIAQQFVNTSGTISETAASYSWFFFGIIQKTMCEYLSTCNRFFLPRRLRFRDAYMQNLSEMCRILTDEMLEKVVKDFRLAKSFNCSLAFFLRDALLVMDRSYVIERIRQYNCALALKINSAGSDSVQTSLIILKLQFMRIICSHEHFVLLNLPFDKILVTKKSVEEAQLHCKSSSEKPSMTSKFPTEVSLYVNTAQPFQTLLDLSDEYQKRHFLLGIVLSDLFSLLKASSLSNTDVSCQSLCIGIVRTLLETHENDPRLSDTGLRHRVAAMYLPLISIVLDAKGLFCLPNGYAATNKEICELGNEEERADTLTEEEELSLICSQVLNIKDTKQLLICFGWVVRNMEETCLVTYLHGLTPERLQTFVDILRLYSSCFELKCFADNVSSSDASLNGVNEPTQNITKDKSSNSSTILRYGTLTRKQSTISTHTMTNSLMESSTYLASDSKVQKSTAGGSTVKWRSMENLVKSYPPNKGIDEIECVFERHLNTQVCLNVLDSFNTLTKMAKERNSDWSNFILPDLVRLLMHMLSGNHSVEALETVLKAQRAVVQSFPELIFEQRSELCAEMCLQLLRHLASRLPQIRSNAAGSLYLLMKNSFLHFHSFSKVKMQATMSLSCLATNAAHCGLLLNEKYLRRSLKTILLYLESDIESAGNKQPLIRTTFATQVKDLVFNLHMILCDTVKIQSFSNDFEMLIDLMYRIAKGYQNNPDLRLTWLISIANRHADRENFMEAAQCILHCAALVAEYLSLETSEFSDILPQSLDEFQELSDNILEESAVSDDTINPEEEDICESDYFTPQGFVRLIEMAAIFFEKAQAYELMPTIYKFIFPMLEMQRNYAKLSRIHHRIGENLKRVDSNPSIVQDLGDPFYSPASGYDKRCFGTYFRVGFYGYKFGDLNGEEFIYKEPQITKLSEISHRLEAFYSNRFGAHYVEIIKDSNNVDPVRLNSEKAYIQVTYVEPYLEIWERKRRSTHFQRNLKLTRFTYATPFTKEGKAHGTLREQYKRKTILTTQHSFPYIKTRLRVVEREQTILSPIEVAIDDLQRKTRELATALVSNPPDTKILQMVLQGCIGTTVNVGPIQIAKVFLSGAILDENGKPRDRLQKKLRLCFKDFSKKCSDALYINKQVIEPERIDYQQELEKNYADFTRQLSEILEPNGNLSTSALARALAVGPVTAV